MILVPFAASRALNLVPSKSQLSKFVPYNSHSLNSLFFIFSSFELRLLYSESLLNLKLDKKHLRKIELLILVLLSNNTVFL